MSSAEEDNYNDGDSPSAQGSAPSGKKRRVQRACDVCRRKKIRCDGGQMPNNRCSNCVAYNYECSYVEAAKKRGPPKGYVESLERRLEQMERVLKSLHPDQDFTKELGAPSPSDAWYPDRAASGSSSMPQSGMSIPPPNTRERTVPTGLPLPPSEEPEIESSDDERVVYTMSHLSLDPIERRFIGKSSGMNLVQAAIDLKREFDGDAMTTTPVDTSRQFSNRRVEYWSIHPWELVKPEARVICYNFPDSDLLSTLIDLYFVHYNNYLPLLHRPTFDKAVAERLHLSNRGFADVLLLVCALGARWSTDPRVLLKNASLHSSGWKYFDQIEVVRNSLMMAPTLYDLQVFALSALFLQASSAPQASWTVVGIGVRLAQDIGAHRKKMYVTQTGVQGELFKRAFWILLCCDRLGSAMLGRPCGMHDEDFDLELPEEIDDEYWDHSDPSKPSKQPPGVPSKVSYFLHFLKLNQILAFALRTIYSINKSKVLLGFVGPQWQQHIVSELDSALNKWVDNVPDHLRWNPNRENLLFFNQSSALYSTYYHIQILVHRPFIPSPRKPSPLSFPSLAICTNAARSCSHVVDVQRRRGGYPLAFMQVAAFTSGVVLLMNLWGAKKRSVISPEPGSQLEDVKKCMHALKVLEPRWYSAGRLWDILNELASSVSDPPTEPKTNSKRSWDDNTTGTADSGSSASTPASDGSNPNRPMASNRRVASQSSPLSPDWNTLMQPSAFASSANLPMNTEELGQMNLINPADMVNPAMWAGVAGASLADAQQLPMQEPPLQTDGMAGPSHQRQQQRGTQPPDAVNWGSMLSDMLNNDQAPLFAPEQVYGNLGEEFGLTFPVMPLVNSTQAAHQQQQLIGVFPPHPGGGAAMGSSNVPMNTSDLVDNDTLAMWSTAPTGFDFEDWSPYVHNLHTTEDSMRLQAIRQKQQQPQQQQQQA